MDVRRRRLACSELCVPAIALSVPSGVGHSDGVHVARQRPIAGRIARTFILDSTPTPLYTVFSSFRGEGRGVSAFAKLSLAKGLPSEASGKEAGLTSFDDARCRSETVFDGLFRLISRGWVVAKVER